MQRRKSFYFVVILIIYFLNGCSKEDDDPTNSSALPKNAIPTIKVDIETSHSSADGGDTSRHVYTYYYNYLDYIVKLEINEHGMFRTINYLYDESDRIIEKNMVRIDSNSGKPTSSSSVVDTYIYDGNSVVQMSSFHGPLNYTLETNGRLDSINHLIYHWEGGNMTHYDTPNWNVYYIYSTAENKFTGMDDGPNGASLNFERTNLNALKNYVETSKVMANNHSPTYNYSYTFNEDGNPEKVEIISVDREPITYTSYHFHYHDL